jgi:enoyl-CoA hydratase
MSYSTITLETRDRVALLTLNRPAVMNAMNRVMLVEMQAACDAVEADASAPWC